MCVDVVAGDAISVAVAVDVVVAAVLAVAAVLQWLLHEVLDERVASGRWGAKRTACGA